MSPTSEKDLARRRKRLIDAGMRTWNGSRINDTTLAELVAVLNRPTRSASRHHRRHENQGFAVPSAQPPPALVIRLPAPFPEGTICAPIHPCDCARAYAPIQRSGLVWPVAGLSRDYVAWWPGFGRSGAAMRPARGVAAGAESCRQRHGPAGVPRWRPAGMSLRAWSSAPTQKQHKSGRKGRSTREQHGQNGIPRHSASRLLTWPCRPADKAVCRSGGLMPS